MGDGARSMASETMWPAGVAPAEPDGRCRPDLLIITRDTYPLFRVDLTELFGRFLSSELRLTWLMDRSDFGGATAIKAESDQTFLLPERTGTSAFINAIRSISLKSSVMLRVLRREWQIVQVRDAALHAFLFMLAAKLGRVRFVYWMSYPIAEGFVVAAMNDVPGRPSVKRFAQYVYGKVAAFVLYRAVIPYSDHVFVQSEKMKEYVVAKGGDASRISPVPMGVSMKAYNPQNIEPVLDEGGSRYLMYMGTVEANRRIDVIIAALQILLSEGRQLHMYILAIGSDGDLLRLRQTIDDCGVEENVTILPRQPLQSALGWVRGADVCLSPYPDDPILHLGTPTKLVEYIAMERPVVANPHPDQCEVIEGSGAGLIAELEPRAFARAVGAMLDDPSWVDRARNGRLWIEENRSYEALSSKVARVYRDLAPE